MFRLFQYAEIMHIAAQQGIIAPPPIVDILPQAVDGGEPQIVNTPLTDDTSAEPLQTADAALGVRNPHQFILPVSLCIIILIVGIFIRFIISHFSTIMH